MKDSELCSPEHRRSARKMEVKMEVFQPVKLA